MCQSQGVNVCVDSSRSDLIDALLPRETSIRLTLPTHYELPFRELDVGHWTGLRSTRWYSLIIADALNSAYPLSLVLDSES